MALDLMALDALAAERRRLPMVKLDPAKYTRDPTMSWLRPHDEY
jgi:predicted dithiol-disulfide oxidoreductase (DUF899 family)